MNRDPDPIIEQFNDYVVTVYLRLLDLCVIFSMRMRNSVPVRDVESNQMFST